FSDRFGRRGLVLGGLIVFVAGSILCSMASSLSVLIAGRITQAVGVCAASVLARAIPRDLFVGEALARVLALTLVAMAAAPGFSPLLGGALDHLFGWKSAFLTLALLGPIIAPRLPSSWTASDSPQSNWACSSRPRCSLSSRPE